MGTLQNFFIKQISGIIKKKLKLRGGIIYGN